MTDLSNVESLLITGTNGFVGRSVINQISKNIPEFLPKNISLVTRNGINFRLPESLESRITIINQDLATKWTFAGGFTHVINLAADGSTSPYSIEANQTFTNIVDNLIEWISESQNNSKVFHASSGACYGRLPIDSTSSENHTKTSFAQNRIDSEDRLIAAAERLGFHLAIGRLFTFSGPYILEKEQYAITDFIKSAVQNKVIRVTGDPQTVRSYLHQDAMAEWILAALICDTSGDILQIGSQEAVTIKELAEYIAQILSVNVRYTADPIPGDVYLPNNFETRTKLGVEEGKSWKVSVEEMINVVRMDSHD
jgi:nucleoside-diphosphate-sugar epimerase